MRTWRTTLLASAAALALTAGSGFAQGMQDHGGAGSPGGGTGAAQQHGGTTAQSPGATTKSGADKADRAAQGTQQPGGSMQKGAERNQPGANRKAEENRGANPQNAQNKTDKDRAQNKTDKDNERNAQNKNNERNKNQAEQQKQNGQPATNRAEQQNREQNRGTAQEQQRSNERNATSQQQRGTNSAAERLEHNGRLQGNASGVNVQLNDQQRKEIRTTVIEKSGAPRVSHVDFDLAVGTVVPRERIHVVPVPETLVQIEPGWRGYMYFVYEDEIVVVNPRDYKIVAVLPV